MYRSQMFAYTKSMNEAFGNPEGNPEDFEATPVPCAADQVTLQFNEKAWMRLFKQCSNIAGNGGEIKGEALELLEALSARDVNKTRDALCDIMVFVLGAYHLMGYDADADMEAVLDGVMTRFCRDALQLQETVTKWAKLGIVDVRAEGNFPFVCVKTNSDQISTTGEFIPANKFLKSIAYKEPVFPPAPPKQRKELETAAQGQRRFFGGRRAEEAGKEAV